jgi:hypothetical protein
MPGKCLTYAKHMPDISDTCLAYDIHILFIYARYMPDIYMPGIIYMAYKMCKAYARHMPDTSWAEASTGMTDRVLACHQFPRNWWQITIKGYWSYLSFYGVDMFLIYLDIPARRCAAHFRI